MPGEEVPLRLTTGSPEALAIEALLAQSTKTPVLGVVYSASTRQNSLRLLNTNTHFRNILTLTTIVTSSSDAGNMFLTLKAIAVHEVTTINRSGGGTLSAEIIAEPHNQNPTRCVRGDDCKGPFRNRFTIRETRCCWLRECPP